MSFQEYIYGEQFPNSSSYKPRLCRNQPVVEHVRSVPTANTHGSALAILKEIPSAKGYVLSEKASDRLKTGCMFFFTYDYVNLLNTDRQSYARCAHRDCCCTQHNSEKERQQIQFEAALSLVI